MEVLDLNPRVRGFLPRAAAPRSRRACTSLGKKGLRYPGIVGSDFVGIVKA